MELFPLEGTTSNKGQRVNVVPFGKYKGQPVEVLQQDPQYVEWLQGQDWFRERHKNIYTIIVNNFGESDETPEHNALQARFLDDEFKWAFMRAAEPRSFVRHDEHGTHYEVGRPAFEVDGWDVKFYVHHEMDWGGRVIDMWRNVHVEIKPTLSDDFPAVLRQVRSRRVDEPDTDNDSRERSFTYVLVGEYIGVGATIEQVKKMFGTVSIVMLPDVEAAIENE